MLRRSVDLLLMPLGCSLLLGVAAIALAIWFKRRRERPGSRFPIALGVAAVLVLYLSSIRPVGVLMSNWLERSYPVRPPDAIERVDAVMVLGGSSYMVRRNSGEITLDPGPRFEAAMLLFEAGRASKLVLSGAGSKIPGDQRSEGEHLRDEALRRGVPDDAIIVTDTVFTTADEARVLAALTREHGWTRVAITTSAAHMARAIRLARAEGLDAMPFTSDVSPPPNAQPWMLDWLPSVDGIWRTTRSWHEILGRLAD